MLRLGTGAWETERIPGPRRTALGVLVVKGLLARDLVVSGVTATELLGGGDVVNPWRPLPGEGFVPALAGWSVLEPAAVALLDPAFLIAASAWPPVVERLFDRAGRRAGRLALQRAIAQLPRVDLRLLALFWHLAERWGRVGTRGLVLPVRLSHETLGRLVGARRPTVTLALGELAARGHVARREDGTWQLRRSAPHVLDVDRPPARRARRGGPLAPAVHDVRLPGDLDPVDSMAAELALGLARLRAVHRDRADALPDQLARVAELRARSADVRRRSAKIRARLAAGRRPPPAAP